MRIYIDDGLFHCRMINQEYEDAVMGVAKEIGRSKSND